MFGKIEKSNNFHPIIQLTAEYSKENINFLHVNISLVDGELMAGLFVKSTDTHQFLITISYHPYHCKKGILFSQALKLNRVCSNSETRDKRCNN